MFGKDTGMLTQKIFRTMMQSMSHPGKIYQFPEISVKNGNTVYDTFSAMCYTLLDHEVTFSVIGKETHDKLIDSIYQLTKSRHVQSTEADYVIVTGGSSLNSLVNLKCGVPEYPDSGATVFYMVNEIDQADGIRIMLEGPGINGRADFRISGIDIEDIKAMKSLNSEFPLGLDTVFLDKKNRIVCIPRSSSIHLEE